MPRFLKEYAYWIAAGVIILVVWGLYLFLVVPHKKSAREILGKIDSAKGQLDGLLRKTEIPNEKWAEGLQEPILRARGHESQVNRFLEGRKRNILNIWLTQSPDWGEKYLDGTSDQMQRIEYRELYPDVVVRVYNELVLPLLSPGEQVKAERSGGGNVGAYIKTISWGEKIPTNKEIVDANTHLNITAAFCEMLLRAKEDVPDLYLFMKSVQVLYLDSSKLQAARGGTMGGMPGGGMPGEGMPGGYDMGGGGARRDAGGDTRCRVAGRLRARPYARRGVRAGPYGSRHGAEADGGGRPRENARIGSPNTEVRVQLLHRHGDGLAQHRCVDREDRGDEGVGPARGFRRLGEVQDARRGRRGAPGRREDGRTAFRGLA
ncbi:MAG: hypothetical protein V2A58_05755 [Planctomycetota bacterium]